MPLYLDSALQFRLVNIHCFRSVLKRRGFSSWVDTFFYSRKWVQIGFWEGDSLTIVHAESESVIFLWRKTIGDDHFVFAALMMLSSSMLVISVFSNSRVFGPAQYWIMCTGGVVGLLVEYGVLLNLLCHDVFPTWIQIWMKCWKNVLGTLCI